MDKRVLATVLAFERKLQKSTLDQIRQIPPPAPVVITKSEKVPASEVLSLVQLEVDRVVQAIPRPRDGSTPVLEMGTVAYLNEGDVPWATLTPEGGKYVLDLGIPPGKRGLRGVRGERGIDGTGGGSSTLTVRTISASGAAADADDVVLVNAASAAITVTLPTAVGRDRSLYVKRISTSAYDVTVATVGGQTIDLDPEKTINTSMTSLELVSDGSNWWIT